jgi:hypothetical protein
MPNSEKVVRPEDEQTLIDAIKRRGIKSALFDAIGTRLWNAKTACEEGRKDTLKDFRNQLDVARQALNEAEILYREWYNS